MESSNRASDRLIAVFTESTYDEWASAEKIALSNYRQSILSWDDANKRLIPYNDVEPCVLKFELGGYLLAVVKENVSRVLQGDKRIDALVRSVIENISHPEKYVAVHSIDSLIQDKQEIEKKVSVLVNYHHVSEYQEFMIALSSLLEVIKDGGADIKTRCDQLHASIINLTRQTQCKKISVLKHKIANYLIPIDIDLQGWQEAGFSAEYGREIRDASIGKSPSPLEQARKQLYEDTYSLNQVIWTRNDNVDSAEKDIMELLPRKTFDTKNELYKNAYRILDDLEIGNMDNVKQALKTANPFHAWFSALMSALDNLRDAIEPHS